MNNLDQKEWISLMNKTSNAVLLDVRTLEEYEEGHIKGARLIDIRQPQKFMDEIETLDKDKSYFVYCRSGNRSSQACLLLKKQNVVATYNLKGGILEWEGDTV